MNKLVVKRIAYEDTKTFILNIHYARRMPCVQYAFGLFDGNYPYPVGIVTYGQLASPFLCKGIAGEDNRKNVLELNRLVFYPEYNGGNYASYLISHSLKMLPRHTFVVSYADWGGGIMSGMCTRQRTGFIRGSQNREQTNSPRVGIQDTTQREKREDNKELQSIGMYIL